LDALILFLRVELFLSRLAGLDKVVLVELGLVQDHSDRRVFKAETQLRTCVVGALQKLPVVVQMLFKPVLTPLLH
jgi:hypothetical protein